MKTTNKLTEDQAREQAQDILNKLPENKGWKIRLFNKETCGWDSIVDNESIPVAICPLKEGYYSCVVYIRDGWSAAYIQDITPMGCLNKLYDQISGKIEILDNQRNQLKHVME